ncbi:MAG TPA: metallophosphoesterase [Planctomycetota bacterium]|nr:metallophosphoesterase [Planctomycetota bacterium]
MNEAPGALRDGVDRRGFLQCAAWAGTGLVWTVSGGVLSSRAFGQDAGVEGDRSADFMFVQISDTHIGFSKEPNKDPASTVREAIQKINALPKAPAFVLHTGDITHLAKPAEFDAAAEVLKGLKVEVHYVPGEHDVLSDETKPYLERYGKGTKGLGWRSFDHAGVHFVGLVNVVNLRASGLGYLGTEQLEWLKKDLEPVKDSTPVVVFTHMPLWTIHEKWGWGTDDSAQALQELRRFGSVTVLNGHIHQIMQKVEGNITFHTARSLAFPQPKPGEASNPGPMKNVAADKLRDMLGITSVDVVARRGALAVVDSTLA